MRCCCHFSNCMFGNGWPGEPDRIAVHTGKNVEALDVKLTGAPGFKK